MTRTADTSETTIEAALNGHRPSLGRVLRDQKRVLFVALFLVVASFWICGPLDKWPVGDLLQRGHRHRAWSTTSPRSTRS